MSHVTCWRWKHGRGLCSHATRPSVLTVEAGRTGRTAQEETLTGLGRVPSEPDITMDKTIRTFMYEAPVTSSLRRTLSLYSSGDGGEHVTLELRLYDPNGHGEGRPYLWAEGIRVSREWLEEALVKSAGNVSAGRQERPRPQGKTGR